MHNSSVSEGYSGLKAISAKSKETSSISEGLEFVRMFLNDNEAKDLSKKFAGLSAEARKYAVHEIVVNLASVPKINFVDHFIQFLKRENDQQVLDSALDGVLFAYRNYTDKVRLDVMENYLGMIENPEIKDRAKKSVDFFKKNSEV